MSSATFSTTNPTRTDLDRTQFKNITKTVLYEFCDTHCAGGGTSSQKAKLCKCGIEYRILISSSNTSIRLPMMVSVYLLTRVSALFFTSQ